MAAHCIQKWEPPPIYAKTAEPYSQYPKKDGPKASKTPNQQVFKPLLPIYYTYLK